MRALHLALAAAAAFSLACSTHYVAPGGPAALRAAGDAEQALALVDRSDIRSELERVPAALFPARLVGARVQAPEYRSFTVRGGSIPGDGFEVLTVQELLEDAQLEAIGAWSSVAGVVPLSRLLLPPRVRDLDDLRLAAAKLQADVLVLYTLDTRFEVQRKWIAPTGVISLGLAPDRDAQVTATASALFVDVRTGFIYGASEASAHERGLASFWSSEEQLDRKRVTAEQRAFGDLVGALEKTWSGVVREHAPANAARDSAG
jgi:hypothetical protein